MEGRKACYLGQVKPALTPSPSPNPPHSPLRGGRTKDVLLVWHGRGEQEGSKRGTKREQAANFSRYVRQRREVSFDPLLRSRKPGFE